MEETQKIKKEVKKTIKRQTNMSFDDHKHMSWLVEYAYRCVNAMIHMYMN